ncbi:MAG: hypothetical protein Q7S53_00060 [bacterium]|nr:hypothetical protein [bacterium]
MSEEKTKEEPKAQEKPKKGKKKLWLILIALLLLIIIGVVCYLFFVRKTGQSAKTSGEISITKNPQLETDKTVSKIIGPGGGVLSTQASDGTLYTLKVPMNALILPTTVTLTPMKKVPFDNYGKADAGKGVQIGDKTTFIRPAFLSIQPNTSKPKATSETGTVAWNRCAIGSRGFDPEICAGLRDIPFGVGVEPGKVVILGSQEYSKIVLNPTIPMGDKNAYNTHVWRAGYYMADKIDKNEAGVLAKKTFEGSYDYVNVTEVLTHLVALGGDLTPYKSEIDRFEREKKDYPREVLKGAILAKIVGNEEAYKKRIDDFGTAFKRNLANEKASFLPWPRYAALYRQLAVEPTKKSTSRFELVQKAYAELPDYDPSANDSNDSSEPELPGYDSSGSSTSANDNPFVTGEPFWPIDIPDYVEPPEEPDSGTNGDFPSEPPELPDVVDPPARTGSEAARRSGSSAIRDAGQKARNDITSRTNSCSEKIEAIETLALLGLIEPEDMQPIIDVLTKCAKSCTTFEECEEYADACRKFGSLSGEKYAMDKIRAFLQEGGDCKDAVKKEGLKDYGINCP